jgi:phage FluMu protein Com
LANSEYFEYMFAKCPYCKSENVKTDNFFFFGAHLYADKRCAHCEKVWNTSNVLEYSWQIEDGKSNHNKDEKINEPN